VRMFGTCVNAARLGAGNVVAVPGVPRLSWIYPPPAPITDGATGIDLLRHLATDLTMLSPISALLGGERLPHRAPTPRRGTALR
jgi:hypothetical protein